MWENSFGIYVEMSKKGVKEGAWLTAHVNAASLVTLPDPLLWVCIYLVTSCKSFNWEKAHCDLLRKT